MGRPTGSRNGVTDKVCREKYLHNNEYWTAKKLAREYRICVHGLERRLSDFTPVQEAIDLGITDKETEKKTKWDVGIKCEYKGQSHTLKVWASIVGISYTTLRSRMKRGMSIHDALTTWVRGPYGVYQEPKQILDCMNKKKKKSKRNYRGQKT